RHPREPCRKIAAVPPATYEPPPSTGFKTPSGNIFCMVPTNEGVRCGIARTNTLPVPGPRDCDLDYGDAFEISETANRGVLVCHGDTVRATASRGAGLGRGVAKPGFTCRSNLSG